jgi:glycosyltransferase involved in cell wall biosynthesis
VYCRRPIGKIIERNEYKGVKLRTLPTLSQKYLETPLHALVSFLDLLFHSYDVVLLCNAANSPFAWIVKLFRTPLLINVDGIERKRKKWSWIGKIWYRLGERCSVLFASKIVADAEVIAEYYRERYHKEPVVIAYGASATRSENTGILQTFGLLPGRYILYVSRLEPENNALGVIEAFNKLNTDYKLAVVGDAPYAKSYIEQLKSIANERVVFTGFQFGDAYHQLRTHAQIYIQASEVGGIHPALLEGMAYGQCVIANDVPEHREALGKCGLYYKKNDFNELRVILEGVLKNQELVRQYGQQAATRARELYSWEQIVDRYEVELRKLAR